MKNTLNDSTLTLQVKKNSIVAGTQAVITIKLGESLDVTPQAVLQPVNFPQDLFSHAGRQPFQVSQGGRGVMNFQEAKIFNRQYRPRQDAKGNKSRVPQASNRACPDFPHRGTGH